MTDINHVPLLPEPPLRMPAPESPRASGWRRVFAVTGILAGGLLLGAGGFALAADEMEHMGWNHGPRLAFIQGMVAHGLDSVGASAEQEAKVHDIIATKFADLAPDPKEHAAMRKQALDLLAAPTIDRAAIEKLRQDVVARFDAKSKLAVGGLLEIADQLTPPQRAQLTAEIEEMAQHGPMGGGWRGGHHGHGDDDRRGGDGRDNNGDSDKD
jgi:periplasmic protein CpxP/Spy